MIKKNAGNFANDPARARESGRKGGRARGKNKSQGGKIGGPLPVIRGTMKVTGSIDLAHE